MTGISNMVLFLKLREYFEFAILEITKNDVDNLLDQKVISFCLYIMKKTILTGLFTKITQFYVRTHLVNLLLLQCVNTSHVSDVKSKHLF